MNRPINNLFILFLAGMISCSENNGKFKEGTFGYDVTRLSGKDGSLHVLTDDEGKGMAIVSAKYQAKVFTSTSEGMKGASIGYVNYKILDSDTVDPHMNGYGGENRFWLGPEGGRYSIFFAPGTEQIYDHWHTPSAIDTEAWDVVVAGQKAITLKKDIEVINYQGERLKVRADRTISLVERAEIEKTLDVELKDGLQTVAYVTHNSITNRNDFEWTQETGAICIWILDMFPPSPEATTVIPFRDGDEASMGKIVTSDYFGDVPADRLKIAKNVIYLRTDGKFRSKLGLNGKRTKSVAGNYDPLSNRLTIITFNVDEDAVYLNQEWNPMKNPLEGDAMNAYNDGPLADGSIMGPFLELESVSPAAFLQPEQTLYHRHTVYHFIGSRQALEPIAQKMLGIGIYDIQNAFK
ncbi:MAG: hypothetical protein LBF89_02310 [Bacteroidales bacterium]|jgi:hypothetical protein|nr:hypothetical protein [Bacteroidales bacterium]